MASGGDSEVASDAPTDASRDVGDHASIGALMREANEAKVTLQATILVGHGVPARGTPRGDVSRLKELEGRRRLSGAAMGEEEAALDRRVRATPRSPENDPYDAGLRRIAATLRQRLAPRAVYVAYNEFCAPSLPDAVAEAVARGALELTVVPSMLVEGGVHSEVEIPEELEALRRAHPGVTITYCWPFRQEAIVALMAEQVERFASSDGGEPD